MQYCPNGGLIRTEIEESDAILSESRAHSDRNRGICFKTVQMAGLFGQKWRNLMQYCPNGGLIRTEIEESVAILSESRAHFDRNRGI
jgi:hypothetical protein